MIYAPGCKWDGKKVWVEGGHTHAASFGMRALSSARIRLVIATETEVIDQSGGKGHDGGEARNL